MTERFATVVALDLRVPSFEYPGVLTIAADAGALPFADCTFDCVVCTEVLEHVRHVERACIEIIRVAKHEVVIGVPFRQDTRVGRTTCRACGKLNPPWGHVNSFTEERLLDLFGGLRVTAKSFVGLNNGVTNPVSALLMDAAGNPWGTYGSEEACIHCGAGLAAPPADRSFWMRLCSALAVRVNRFQMAFTRPHANWIHLALSKDR
jgi:SAM-dependent methyltransferase